MPQNVISVGAGPATGIIIEVGNGINGNIDDSNPAYQCELNCLACDPTNLIFPTVEIGSSLQLPVTITNSGADCFNITGVTIDPPGNFSVPGTFPVGVGNQGGSVQLIVEFSPTATGSVMGTVTIVPEDFCSPTTISCQGNGIDPSGDFYVRDWTSSTGADDGSEPSTDPIYWTTSDVWNQNTDVIPPLLAADAPTNSNPVSGSQNNFAFARISRVSQGSEYPVYVQWFGADWGIGNNFAPIGATQSIPFPSGTTTPQFAFTQWTPGTENDHYCMAAQIWSRLADGGSGDTFGRNLNGAAVVGDGQQIVNDKDQAQRNMSIVAGVSGHDFHRPFPLFFYATIHNAALVTRDMVLAYRLHPGATDAVLEATVSIVGTTAKADGDAGLLTLPNMQPGESRYLAFTCNLVLSERSDIQIDIMEISSGKIVNGFSQLVRVVEDSVATEQTLLSHRQDNCASYGNLWWRPRDSGYERSCRTARRGRC